MKIFITRRIPDAAVNYLTKKKYSVKVWEKDSPIPQKELLKNVKDISGLISLLSDKIDSSVIDTMNNCRVIANYAVGFNNIDVQYAKQKGIVVTNTPDVLTDSTADIAMGLAIACARRFHEGENLVRKNKFKGWAPKMLLGIELKNKIFGIVGAGRIGIATAKRAKAFGCKIIYSSNSVKKEFEASTGAKKVPLNTLLKKSDFISLHVPLNDKTFHLLNKERLALLKETAVLINTSRGEVVDEKELIKILKKKKIFAAGFDVYENEPAVNPQLMKLDNVILLPHLGSATFETREAMALLAAKNIDTVLSGRKPISPVF